MKKRLLLIFLLIIFLNCLSLDVKQKIKKDNDKYFKDIADKYINQKNFRLLKEAANARLEVNDKDYTAAYYKALALQKNNKLQAMQYYIDFIKNHPETPDEYKNKWIDFALEVNNKRKQRIKLLNLKAPQSSVELKYSSDLLKYCKSRVLANNQDIFFLDSDGSLYHIKKNSKLFKKINYYKSRDFIIFNDYIVFNDSINLVKFFYEKNKYDSIHSFDEDEIYFYNPSSSLPKSIIKYIDSGHLINKYFDFETARIINLPDNFIASSPDFSYIILKYSNSGFEIYDINGNFLLFIKGNFIDFGIESSDLYYYNNNYLCYYNFDERKEYKLIYIPGFESIKGFKAISKNKILFCFDNYMLVYNHITNRVYLINGELLHIFNTGYMYKNNENKGLLYFNFFDNTKNLIYLDEEIINQVVFPDNNSSVFIIKFDNKIILNDLKDYFYEK